MTIGRRPWWAVSLAALTACQSLPPSLQQPAMDTALTPGRAQARGVAVEGRVVRWGGRVIRESHTGADTDTLEILAFPLAPDGRPIEHGEGLGRFLARTPRSLVTDHYVHGDRVTVAGALAPPVTGLIGQAQYHYPVVRVVGLHEWPAPAPTPTIGFGFAIGISR